MHGAVPRGPHEHHLVAAIFHATSGARFDVSRVIGGYCCGNRCAHDYAGGNGVSVRVSAAIGATIGGLSWIGFMVIRQFCHQLGLQVGASRYRGPPGARHGTLLVRGLRAAIKDGD
jgi:hypothetical protein